jgi:trigger factor
MSDDTSTNEGFEFVLEDAGPARKRLKVTISAEAVQKKIDASMGTLQFQSALPGFRKGKAPKHLLERRFGPALREETCNELMQEGCEKAFEELGVRPLGNMEPDDPKAEVSIEAGQPLSFGVVFEVVPDFDMPDISKIEIAKPNLEVEDEHIDDELERQCLRMGNAEEITTGLTTADRLLGATELFIEGEEEAAFTHEQILVIIPEAKAPGQILGLSIDDLDKTFNKASVGDTVEITTTGPEAHEREDIRGKSLRITYTIHLAERITPATQDELMEQFSLASIDVLREQIRLALEQQRDEQQASVMREQLLEKVSDQLDMELPEKLSGNQVAADLERVRMELMQQGLDDEQVEIKLAEIRDRSTDQTLTQLKTWFLLERVANEEDLSVSEQEINGRIATMAMQQGVRPDKLRAELVKSDRIMALARSIRERKAVDHLVGIAKVSDITMKEWDKRVEAKKAAAKS